LSRQWRAKKLVGALLLGLAAALLFPPTALADPSPPASAADSANLPPAGAAATSDWPAMLFVFMLATFIGLGVITRVSRLLHTPLMSLTNAISAIAVVAAIAMAGSDHALPITILGAIALFASTTNIVSGFLITDRMLKMFKRQEPK
jgi:NAD(P) transhydrogenase subunit alpha